VTVSQSVAVLLYCAEKSGKFLPKDPAARPAFLAGARERGERHERDGHRDLHAVPHQGPHGPAIDVFKSMWKNYMKVWTTGSASSATPQAAK